MWKSDWKVLSLGAIVASLGLSACGVSASMNEAVSSVGASPYLQVHLTADVSGAGAQQAKLQQALTSLSVDVFESSTTGSALSQSVGTTNSEVDVNVGSTPLLQLRQIGKDAYVEVDVTALAGVPGVTLTQQQLSLYQLLFGGRWFEVPASLIANSTPTSAATQASAAKDQAAGQTIVDQLTTLIDATPYTTLPGGGYSQTGTLASVVTAVLPTIESLAGHTINTGTVSGTYTISIAMSGTTATGGSIHITTPNGTTGDATVGLDATVAHAVHDVVAPSGAIIITPTLIKQLEGQVSAPG